MPPTATEAWPAIFGGLIPILGLAAIGYLIWHAVKSDTTDDPGASEEPNSSKNEEQ
jgi:hypothetical protein